MPISFKNIVKLDCLRILSSNKRTNSRLTIFSILNFIQMLLNDQLFDSMSSYRLINVCYSFVL